MYRASTVSRMRRPLSVVGALAVTVGTLAVSTPDAGAGPCSTMFGNFGSLRDSLTGAGMGAGSAGSAGSASSGSAGSLLDQNGSLVQQLQTGSIGNGLSGSLDPLTGSVYGFPQWTVSPESGTVPVLSGPTRFVQLVTGPTSPNQTIAKYGVNGTDLGIMWDDGNPAGSRVDMAFGDTMGDCSIPGNQWRSNVLFHSTDRTLSDGLTVSGALTGPDGLATSIVPRSGLPGETTIIPTAGIEVGGVQYLRFMSVAKWGTPSSWTTNYSGLAYSTDFGKTWQVDPTMARPITDAVPAGTGAPPVDRKWARAQMSSFVKGTDGFLYEYLTPSGRSGAAIVARVPMQPASGTSTPTAPVRTPSAYTYWDGTAWVPDITRAATVLPAPVSEVSVQWNAYLGKYVSMYSAGLDSVLIRTADRPEGPWSGPTPLIDYSLLPGVYGGFMHPWSTGKDLYYVVTTWDSYNVFLVHTDLSQIRLSGFAPAGERASGPADTPTQSQVVRRVPVDQLPGGMVPTR